MAGSGLLDPSSPALDREVEQRPDVEPLHVGVPVGEGSDNVASTQGLERRHRVLVVLDGVPRREEHLEPRPGEAFRLRIRVTRSNERNP